MSSFDFWWNKFISLLSQLRNPRILLYFFFVRHMPIHSLVWWVFVANCEFVFLVQNPDLSSLMLPSLPRSVFSILKFNNLLCYTLSGFSDDSNSQKETKNGAHSSSSSMSGSTILILIIAVATVVGLSVFLFRLWQKKKREEQYARLLKLFEEDDELELELGLRDWAGWGRFFSNTLIPKF